ncbi:MAG: hypothetical protein ACRDP4_05975 [Nocardioidaceae bacterium]
MDEELDDPAEGVVLRLIGRGVRRLSILLVAVVAAGGVVLMWVGWHQLSKAAYAWGLVILALALGVALLMARGRLLVRLVPAAVVVALVIVAGIVGPNRAASSGFDGLNVQWSVPSASPQYDSLLDAGESIQLRVGGALVVASEHWARLVALSDGHEIAELGGLDAGDDFVVAAGRLLVIDDHRSAMLYDQHGNQLWGEPIDAEAGVAASRQSVVLESCEGDGLNPCTVTGYGLHGHRRWHRSVTPKVASAKNVHLNHPDSTWLGSAQQLPIFRIEQPLEVLPAYAVAPLSRQRLAFLDPDTGKKVWSVRGGYGGTTSSQLVAVDYDDVHKGCVVHTQRLPGDSAGESDTFDVPCSSAHGAIQDGVLFLPDASNGTSARGVDLDPLTSTDGVRLPLADVYLQSYPETIDLSLAVSGQGMTMVEGSLVAGYPETKWSDKWTFHASSEWASADTGSGATVVYAKRPITNPFDDAEALDDDSSVSEDSVVTVLRQEDGTVTGRVRVHDIASVLPVGNGCAVVSADQKLRKIGGTCDASAPR